MPLFLLSLFRILLHRFSIFFYSYFFHTPPMMHNTVAEAPYPFPLYPIAFADNRGGPRFFFSWEEGKLLQTHAILRISAIFALADPNS